jgi:hypothetical protein
VELKQGKITIITQVDEGVETSSVFSGEMGLLPTEARIVYRDGESSVRIQLNLDTLTIERSGDYGFFLELKEGELLPAKLNVAGSEGTLTAGTEYLRYSIKEKSLLLSVKYALVFVGGERQEMKIRLTARLNGSEES